MCSDYLLLVEANLNQAVRDIKTQRTDFLRNLNFLISICLASENKNIIRKSSLTFSFATSVLLVRMCDVRIHKQIEEACTCDGTHTNKSNNTQAVQTEIQTMRN